VYLSLTRPRPAAGVSPDNAFAVCETTKKIPLPGYCPTDSAGEVRVAYTTSSDAFEGGADTLTAAVDLEGTDAATDQYVYPARPGTAVASYRWSPDPVAPAATLHRGKAVKVTLSALNAEGIPVPAAPVLITFAPAPGSDATLAPPATGCSGSAVVRTITGTGKTFNCRTAKNGALTLTYTSSTTVPEGGSDGLTASQPKTAGPSADAAKPATKTPAPAPTADTYSYLAVSHFTWTADPIAVPGSLTPGQKVTLKATALNAAGHPVSDAMVYVSLAKPLPSTEPGGDADNSSATCGTTKTILLPASCRTNDVGQVQVTYTTSTHQYELGGDVLTAAVDPFGTAAAADEYTYAAPPGTPVASYSWSPDPLAAAETLAAGGTVQAAVTALDDEGNPVPGASVAIALDPAPGSKATLKPPAQGCTGLTCRTGRVGTITVTYISSAQAPNGGSDGIIATQPKTTGPSAPSVEPATTTPAPSPATNYYSYD
jgi:hypothetical protein